MVNYSGYWNSEKYGLLYFQYCSYAETRLLIEKNVFTKKEIRRFQHTLCCSFGIYEKQESFDSFVERMSGLHGNTKEGMEYHFETHFSDTLPQLVENPENDPEYLKNNPGHYWIEQTLLKSRYVYYTDGKRIASRVAWTDFFLPEFMRQYEFVGRRECRFYGSPEFLASTRKQFQEGMFDDLQIQKVWFEGDDENDEKKEDR